VQFFFQDPVGIFLCPFGLAVIGGTLFPIKPQKTGSQQVKKYQDKDYPEKDFTAGKNVHLFNILKNWLK
jgi:hypothetical protein